MQTPSEIEMQFWERGTPVPPTQMSQITSEREVCDRGEDHFKFEYGKLTSLNLNGEALHE